MEKKKVPFSLIKEMKSSHPTGVAGRIHKTLVFTLIVTLVFLVLTKNYLDSVDCITFRLRTQRELGSVQVLGGDPLSKEEMELLKKNQQQKRVAERKRLIGVKSKPRRKAALDFNISLAADIVGNDAGDLTRNRAANISPAQQALFVRRPAEFLSKLDPTMTLSELVNDEKIVCELLMYELGNCLEGEGTETCIERIGARNVEAIMPARCRESHYFKALVKADPKPAADPMVWHFLKRTSIYNEQVYHRTDSRPQYIPPAKRPAHAYTTGPRVCNGIWSRVKGCEMHPIGFAVPEMAIAKEISRVKYFDFLPFLPRWYPLPKEIGYSLGLHEEQFSRLLYRHSFFAFTHRRGGWDCLRHYESFTEGTLPYFPDIHQCDKYCMTAFPKDLAKKVLQMRGVSHIGYVKEASDGVSSRYMYKEPGVAYNNPKLPHVLNFRAQGDINWDTFNITGYFDLAQEMLEYARKYSTTKSLVTYMLQVIGTEEPRNVLVITGKKYRYLIESILHGMYDLGLNYTVVNHDKATQRIQTDTPLTEMDLEDQREPYHGWQGLLYTYGLRRLDPNPPGDDLADIRARILNHEYDLIIYPWTVHPDRNVKGEFLKDRLLWEEVSTVYLPPEIVFVDTTDDLYFDPTPVLMEMCGKGTIFRRSLHDKEC